MAKIIGNSVRKCGQQTPHQGHHWYESTLPEDPSGGWNSNGVAPVTVTHYCTGQPDDPFGVPGYVIRVSIRPDDRLEGSGMGLKVEVAKPLEAHLVESVLDGRDVVQTVLRDAALMVAERFSGLVEAEHAERTGQRPMTPEERFHADRRRRGARIPEVLHNLTPPPPVPGEREVWGSGMVPANPAVCRYCRGRIVYAYPQWTLDSDVDSWTTDPSVCPDATSLGHYHEPEASSDLG